MHLPSVTGGKKTEIFTPVGYLNTVTKSLLSISDINFTTVNINGGTVVTVDNTELGSIIFHNTCNSFDF